MGQASNEGAITYSGPEAHVVMRQPLRGGRNRPERGGGQVREHMARSRAETRQVTRSRSGSSPRPRAITSMAGRDTIKTARAGAGAGGSCRGPTLPPFASRDRKKAQEMLDQARKDLEAGQSQEGRHRPAPPERGSPRSSSRNVRSWPDIEHKERRYPPGGATEK